MTESSSNSCLGPPDDDVVMLFTGPFSVVAAVSLELFLFSLLLFAVLSEISIAHSDVTFRNGRDSLTEAHGEDSLTENNCEESLTETNGEDLLIVTKGEALGAPAARMEAVVDSSVETWTESASRELFPGLSSITLIPRLASAC